MTVDRRQIEITKLSKVGGPLTKRIMLASDGSLRSKGSACVMSEGQARRAKFDNLEAFGTCIANLNPRPSLWAHCVTTYQIW